ncbi:MAG: OmpH family outer membrane protein [Bacteroidaceae bacterium]|nr:OmpH family outer membrane protein [Bacteroidaceae bacterium]
MRKLFLFLSLFAFAVSAKAQFGYYSSNSVLQMLPSYKQAVSDYELLRSRCEKEIEHNERELTRQYVAFLDGYRDFPEPILRKRQNELQRLVDNSVKFRKELKMWLAEAKDSLFAPSNGAVAAALEKVCIACDIDYAIDTDEAVYKYINPKKSVDITRMLLDALLNPEKPVTALDGYDDFLRVLKPAEQTENATLIETETTVKILQQEDTEAVIGEGVATDVEDVASDEEGQE